MSTPDGVCLYEINKISPRYYPQQQLSVPSATRGPSYQVTPTPQVIIVKHSHRRHRQRTHSHSHSHSQPVVIPQQVTYSNSHPPYYQSPTVIHPQPHHYSSSPRPSNQPMGYVPPSQPSQPQGPVPTSSQPHYDERSPYSKCTGRKKALCVRFRRRTSFV